MKNFSSKHFLAAIILATQTLSTLPARAENFNADIFELGSNHAKKLFSFTHNESSDGEKTVETIVTSDLDGKAVVKENLTTLHDKILKYDQSQLQLGESGSASFSGGRLILSYTKNGESDTATEDYPDNLAVPPSIGDFLKRNWDQILKGDTVSARFAALDRKETVGFKYFKVGETKFDGQDAIVVKMKPSSFVIAALVDPLHFTMAKDGSRILKMEGRVLAKQKVDGKWKDLDAEIVYHYPGALPKSKTSSSPK